MRRLAPNRDLTVELHPTMRKFLYANSVTELIVTSTDDYTVSTFDIMCGTLNYSPARWLPGGQVTEHELSMSVPMIWQRRLVLTSANGKREYYSVDLTSIIPENWMTRVERLNDRKPISFGLVVTRPGCEHLTAPVHRLTNADLKHPTDPHCPSRAYGQHVFTGTVQCGRFFKHLGRHQAFTEGFSYVWDRPELPTVSPFGDFGFRSPCPYCGFVMARGAHDPDPCPLCLMKLRNRAHLRSV